MMAGTAIAAAGIRRGVILSWTAWSILLVLNREIAIVKPMSRPRFDKLEPGKRQRLLESAAEEFAAKGYDGASLNRILAASGISKSSLYYYFDDKADLFTTLVEQSLGLLFREVGEFDLRKLTRENYWAECEALYRRCIATMSSDDTWYVKLGRMFYRLRADQAHSAPTERLFDAARHWVGALLARGQELGVVRADMPGSLLVDCVMGMGEALDRWAVSNWETLDEEARHSMAGEHVDLFRRLLTP